MALSYRYDATAPLVRAGQRASSFLSGYGILGRPSEGQTLSHDDPSDRERRRSRYIGRAECLRGEDGLRFDDDDRDDRDSGRNGSGISKNRRADSALANEAMFVIDRRGLAGMLAAWAA